MLTLYTRFDETVHQVVRNSDLALWIKRRFPGERLFLYRHRETGAFVIGQMQTNGMFCDVMNLGPVQGMNREKAEHLRFLFSDQNTPGMVGRMMKANYDARMRRMQDTADADSSRIMRQMSTKVSVAM